MGTGNPNYNRSKNDWKIAANRAMAQRDNLLRDYGFLMPSSVWKLHQKYLHALQMMDITE
ncbi:hypothetical protein [Caulobacter phage Cr30]|uniref:hypothetical protein n=1 Tax=Caulobacter phage Cr30 TaxID=1357714 RepID=UPI0004A9B5A9|nr:hypothetical protein OZ74_gp227 [Caulobacter phage Cr30]AGS81116.1 hypothetical protein [Caulobacter phage Cr30]